MFTAASASPPFPPNRLLCPHHPGGFGGPPDPLLHPHLIPCSAPPNELELMSSLQAGSCAGLEGNAAMEPRRGGEEVWGSRGGVGGVSPILPRCPGCAKPHRCTPVSPWFGLRAPHGCPHGTQSSWRVGDGGVGLEALPHGCGGQAPHPDPPKYRSLMRQLHRWGSQHGDTHGSTRRGSRVGPDPHLGDP